MHNLSMKFLQRCHLVLLPIVLAAACQSPEASSSENEPLPMIAVSNMLHPPFSSRDENGQAVGVEVELIEEAARRLGREVEWIELSFGELIDAVAAGEADVAASTLGITEARAKIVAFSAPYFSTGIVALTRTADGEPRTLGELAGKLVATERGTTTVEATAKRIPEARRVLDKQEGRTWQEMLITGDIDAIVLDGSHAEKFMTDGGTPFHVIAEPLRIEKFGLAVHQGNAELLEALNDVIAQYGVVCEKAL
ncbi:MAG: polar amino acid transport system substrate-binding protein [Planctomycetota bacterium]